MTLAAAVMGAGFTARHRGLVTGLLLLLVVGGCEGARAVSPATDGGATSVQDIGRRGDARSRRDLWRDAAVVAPDAAFSDGPFDGPKRSDAGVGADRGVPAADVMFDSVPPIAACGGVRFQCGDGVDNDGDGVADEDDPECTGPCDGDESSFGVGMANHGNKDPCSQDCYFDGNSGRGDDRCSWNTKCDPADPARVLLAYSPKLYQMCRYDPSYPNCPAQQDATCHRRCLPLAPNGCDCFGCCAFPLGSSTVHVWLGACQTAPDLADPSKCARCTPVADCYNRCETCEICLGKPFSALPASCFYTAADGGAGHGGSSPRFLCPQGAPCLQRGDCPVGDYCLTGCCVSAR